MCVMSLCVVYEDKSKRKSENLNFSHNIIQVCVRAERHDF